MELSTPTSSLKWDSPISEGRKRWASTLTQGLEPNWIINKQRTFRSKSRLTTILIILQAKKFQLQISNVLRSWLDISQIMGKIERQSFKVINWELFLLVAMNTLTSITLRKLRSSILPAALRQQHKLRMIGNVVRIKIIFSHLMAKSMRNAIFLRNKWDWTNSQGIIIMTSS